MKDYLDEYIVATRLIYRPEGASVEELAEALKKTPRAVFSILNQLDNMFPLYTEQDPSNPKKLRYKADKAFAEYLPSLAFTENDKAVFNYLINNAQNTPAIEKDATRLFTKLKLMAAERGALIEAGNNKPIPIIGAKTIHKQVNTKNTDKTTEVLLSIIDGHKWMDITYKSMSAGEYHPYHKLFPLVIFIWQGDSYVYVVNSQESLRMLALERFKSIDRVYDDEAPKKSFDVASILSDPFGIMYDTEPFEVKVQLTQMEATYEKQKDWPESVTFTDCPDGTSIMTATTHSLFDCRRWILARIPSAIVLEPQWLCEDIKKAIAKALEEQSKTSLILCDKDS